MSRASKSRSSTRSPWKTSRAAARPPSWRIPATPTASCATAEPAETLPDPGRSSPSSGPLPQLAVVDLAVVAGIDRQRVGGEEDLIDREAGRGQAGGDLGL